MNQMIEFYIANKAWLFSGFGVATLSLLIGFLVEKSKKSDSYRISHLSRGNVMVRNRINTSDGFIVGKRTDSQLMADFKNLTSEENQHNKSLKKDK